MGRCDALKAEARRLKEESKAAGEVGVGFDGEEDANETAPNAAAEKKPLVDEARQVLSFPVMGPASSLTPPPRPSPPRRSSATPRVRCHSQLTIGCSACQLDADIEQKRKQLVVMARNIDRYTAEIQEAAAAGQGTTRTLLHAQAKERYGEMQRAMRTLLARRAALNADEERLQHKASKRRASKVKEVRLDAEDQGRAADDLEAATAELVRAEAKLAAVEAELEKAEARVEAEAVPEGSQRAEKEAADEPEATVSKGVGEGILAGFSSMGNFAAQVSTIKTALDIDASLAIAPALRQANEMMGLSSAGSLPSQAAAILAQLGLEVEDGESGQ